MLLIIPSLGPGSLVKSVLKELVLSPCPPDEAIVFPEVKILGPSTNPSLIAFLRLIVIKSLSPRFLTVVNPARRVFLAFTTALIA